MFVTTGYCDKAQLACDILQTSVLRVLMSSKDQHGGLDSSTPYGLVEITGFSGTKVKKKIVVKVKYFV